MMGNTYLIVGALPTSLINFRGDLIASLVSSGANVVAMAEPADRATVRSINALGATFVPFPVRRRGLNPFSDVRTIFSLILALRKIKPDAVLCYTVKPILYGAIAARFVPSARLVALVEGLGYAFQGGNVRRRVLSWFVQNLYRFSLRRAQYVVFLNADNRETFVQRRVIGDAKAVEIAGIGVNLTKFPFSTPPSLPVCFVMISRLLKEKGIREYCRAAAIVKERYPEVRFILAGQEDNSSDCISVAEIQRIAGLGNVEYVGPVDDVAELIAKGHVFVLPSYHEGRPRTVQEALAVGRPVITSDAPGCRDSILDGRTGFIVGVKDVSKLVERMSWFIENSECMAYMPRACRAQAEEMYDAEKINRQLVSLLADRERD